MMKEGNDSLLWSLVRQHAGRCPRQPGGLRHERGVVFVVGKQEESSEALRRRLDCGIVSVVALEAE
jgi:hypothetical protein